VFRVMAVMALVLLLSSCAMRPRRKRRAALRKKQAAISRVRDSANALPRTVARAIGPHLKEMWVPAGAV
jgi:hypothetical protein